MACVSTMYRSSSVGEQNSHQQSQINQQQRADNNINGISCNNNNNGNYNLYNRRVSSTSSTSSSSYGRSSSYDGDYLSHQRRRSHQLRSSKRVSFFFLFLIAQKVLPNISNLWI